MKSTFHSGFGERTWLKKHGKEKYLSFSEEAILELRKYFNSLTGSKKKSVGVAELEDPLIAFGLAENREEVI